MSQQQISPLASVSPEAKLGEGVLVHPFAVIEANTELGEGCIIESGAVIKSGSRLGTHCHIHPEAFLRTSSTLVRRASPSSAITSASASVLPSIVVPSPRARPSSAATAS